MTIAIFVGSKVALVDDDCAEIAELTWRLWSPPKSTLCYAVRSKGHSLHRAVLGLTDSNGLVVDHINGDGLDNRRENLRLVSREENSRNLAGASRSNQSSGELGVSWHKNRNKWVAHIRVDKKQRYLGIFDTKEKAVAARLKAEEAVWGIQPRRAEKFSLRA